MSTLDRSYPCFYSASFCTPAPVNLDRSDLVTLHRLQTLHGRALLAFSNKLDHGLPPPKELRCGGPFLVFPSRLCCLLESAFPCGHGSPDYSRQRAKARFRRRCSVRCSVESLSRSRSSLHTSRNSLLAPPIRLQTAPETAQRTLQGPRTTARRCRPSRASRCRRRSSPSRSDSRPDSRRSSRAQQGHRRPPSACISSRPRRSRSLARSPDRHRYQRRVDPPRLRLHLPHRLLRGRMRHLRQHIRVPPSTRHSLPTWKPQVSVP